MQRRTYLAGCTGLAGALAGCAGVLDGSDGESNDDRGPAETVEAFYDAALDGDAEAARSYFHAEAQVPPPTDRAIEGVSESTLRLEGTDLVEEDGTTARVEATISQAATGGEREERTVAFELREAHGEWKIYDQPLAGSDGPVAPQVQWDASARTDDSGAVTAVAFGHGGGDTIDVARLGARAAGSTAGPATADVDVTVGTTLLVPLDRGGDALTAGTDVALVWTDPESGQEQTLATYTLGDDTAGSMGDRLQLDS